jgi:hypothetical protein
MIRHASTRRAVRLALVLAAVALYGLFAVAATMTAFWLTFA